MRNVFCTIITSDYVPFARAIFKRLADLGAYNYVVFVADADKSKADQYDFPEGTTFLDVKDVCTRDTGKAIHSKYASTYLDGFRWSMKPVLMQYILENSLGDQVAYVDSDLFFYNSPDFLFVQLKENSVLVSPHWRSSDPSVDYWQYLLLYNQGLFNGGFVAANHDGIPALSWWAKACLAHCENNPERALFVDQVHLNLLPVYFPGTGIIQHRGCNIAGWNFFECQRKLNEHGELLVNNKYPVIFIHYTPNTIKWILQGRDAVLQPLLDDYVAAVKSAGVKKDILAYPRELISKHGQNADPTFIERLKKWINR
jgi:hypothetical protein